MSFLFQGVSVPLIVLLILIGTSTPVFIKLYKMFHSKFIKTGKLQKKLDEVVVATENQFAVVKQATHRIAANISQSSPAKKPQTPQKKPESHSLEKEVLRVLAEKKDSGMLDRSIADTLGLDPGKTNKLLEYLLNKQFIESVNVVHGVKYYLTARGKTYCQKKGYIE